MCVVNGVFFFSALERVSDAVYSCVEEELSLFHMEWEPAGLIEAANGLSETITPCWRHHGEALHHWIECDKTAHSQISF